MSQVKGEHFPDIWSEEWTDERKGRSRHRSILGSGTTVLRYPIRLGSKRARYTGFSASQPIVITRVRSSADGSGFGYVLRHFWLARRASIQLLLVTTNHLCNLTGEHFTNLGNNTSDVLMVSLGYTKILTHLYLRLRGTCGDEYSGR